MLKREEGRSDMGINREVTLSSRDTLVLIFVLRWCTLSVGRESVGLQGIDRFRIEDSMYRNVERSFELRHRNSQTPPAVLRPAPPCPALPPRSPAPSCLPHRCATSLIFNHGDRPANTPPRWRTSSTFRTNSASATRRWAWCRR